MIGNVLLFTFSFLYICYINYYKLEQRLLNSFRLRIHLLNRINKINIIDLKMKSIRVSGNMVLVQANVIGIDSVK